MAVRTRGDWEGWIRFFLMGVLETANEAALTAQRIIRLREHHREMLMDAGMGTNELRLLEALFERPLVNTALASRILGKSEVTAGKVVSRLESLGLLDEITGKERYRVYRYTPYWQMFNDQDGSMEEDPPGQQTLTT